MSARPRPVAASERINRGEEQVAPPRGPNLALWIWRSAAVLPHPGLQCTPGPAAQRGGEDRIVPRA